MVTPSAAFNYVAPAVIATGGAAAAAASESLDSQGWAYAACYAVCLACAMIGAGEDFYRPWMRWMRYGLTGFVCGTLAVAALTTTNAPLFAVLLAGGIVAMKGPSGLAKWMEQRRTNREAPGG